MARDDERRDRIAAELLLLTEGGRALDVLARVGPVLVFKGASLSELLWAPGERSMTDVDLLVRPDLLEDARRAMGVAGWSILSTPGRPLGNLLHRAFAAKSPRGILVDVHAHVAQRVRWPVPYQDLHDRAVPFSLGGKNALRPSLEDATLIAALNEAKDEHALHGSSIEDIARIVARGPLDWDLVVKRARAWRATVALWLALERAATRFGAAVPAAVRKTLRPRRGPAIERLLDIGGENALSRLMQSRRIRQAVLGPLVTDSPTRFLASALAFVAVRAVDAAASATSVAPGERAGRPAKPR